MSKGEPALIIGFGEKAHGEDKSSDHEKNGTPGSDDEDGGEDVSADELADAIGVPDEKRDDFKSALLSCVKICVAKAMKE